MLILIGPTWGLILHIFVVLLLTWLEIEPGFHLVFELFAGAYQRWWLYVLPFDGRQWGKQSYDYELLVQVFLPDDPSWGHLGAQLWPLRAWCHLSCVSHQHTPERLAILIPSLLGEEWRKGWCKYHARLSHKSVSEVKWSLSVMSDSLRPHGL